MDGSTIAHIQNDEQIVGLYIRNNTKMKPQGRTGDPFQSYLFSRICSRIPKFHVCCTRRRSGKNFQRCYTPYKELVYAFYHSIANALSPHR